MTTLGFYFRLDRDEANAMRASLNEIAQSHGYIAHGGPTHGEGNAAALLVAIAGGEVATVLLSDEQRAMAIEFLAGGAATAPWPLRDALTSLAESLTAAAVRERENE